MSELRRREAELLAQGDTASQSWAWSPGGLAVDPGLLTMAPDPQRGSRRKEERARPNCQTGDSYSFSAG